jgi:hypothetical protein
LLKDVPSERLIIIEDILLGCCENEFEINEVFLPNYILQEKHLNYLHT